VISIVFAAPFVNLVGFGLVWWLTEDWTSVVVCAGLWLVTLILQHLTSSFMKKLKIKESESNEHRLKLVNDAIQGAKTMKSQGWESYFIEGMKSRREVQSKYVKLQGILGSLGISLFQNIGLIVMIVVVGIRWLRNESLDEKRLIPLLALVFYLFIAVNS
jgi:ABC-type multidrug transport system fused ATPase/permease subunit